ncbi:type II toxin-antitoxin system VapB family antitoxin [Rhodoferax sp.]|uniref:type II toxin-antitoxin system VapB family antitoxin n=1 Tax=Rhodoferax sp. TaxID=50421 RepID=UPI00345B6C85
MQEKMMRTTLTIDEQLYAKAVALAPPGIEKSELIRECGKAFIQRQTARRLADLGALHPILNWCRAAAKRPPPHERAG